MFWRNEITEDVTQPPPRSLSRRPWWQLEEHVPHGGMWAIPPAESRAGFIEASAALMADPDRFEAAMRRALRDWPNSVEAAMATPGLNLRAWVGHAGCYVATGSPEETTRLGWHTLDAGEQYAANAAADRAIAAWRTDHAPEAQPDLFGGEW